MNDIWTHDRLQADLYRKRRAAKATVAWSEIEIPGTKGGRFDVFAVRSHDARATDTFLGYEVKASLADLESDLSTGKWKRYLPACDQFFFALGPDLEAHINRIPEGPGVMLLVGRERHHERWQVKRKPTGKHREITDVDIWKRLAMREHWSNPVTPKSRLERMEEYARMESLSGLLAGRVRDEIARTRQELVGRASTIERRAERADQLEQLESELGQIPKRLHLLAELLRMAAWRMEPPRSFSGGVDRSTINQALDLLMPEGPS